MKHHVTVVYTQQPAVYQDVDTSTEIVRLHYDRIGVGEVAELTKRAYLRPAAGTTQTLTVSADQLTVEAQQAFLKLLEEPPTSTRFKLILPIGTALLPTITSRVGQITTVTPNQQQPAWNAFIAASIADRLQHIATWQKQKNQTWLQEMQLGLRAFIADTTPTPTLALVAERLGTRGASNKLLLEALALELQT